MIYFLNDKMIISSITIIAKYKVSCLMTEEILRFDFIIDWLIDWIVDSDSDEKATA